MNKFTYKLKGFTVGFVLSIFLVAGAVYAWNAVWHGTDWIQTGQPITSRETAENFEYLKRRIEDLENRINNTDNSTTTLISIEELPVGMIVAGCDYGLYTNSSRYAASTAPYCWGGASSGTRGYRKTCPANTHMFNIWDTVDSTIAGGDGAPYTSYQRNLQGFLCVKQ